MNQNPKATLVVLAAGIGSRFGNNEIKQLALLGPNNHCIMEYSIYDAIEVGFSKILFIIRPDMKQLFEDQVGTKISHMVEVEYAYQRLTDLPNGLIPPADRQKPWGTGQAVIACEGKLNEPFLIINADDYYAKETFQLAYDWLIDPKNASAGDKLSVCSIGFVLGNTLSDFGTVTRGICAVDANNCLSGVDETKGIVKTETGAGVQLADGTIKPLDPAVTVSMNVWGAYPGLLDALKEGFVEFLNDGGAESLKEEFLLPVYIDRLIQTDKAVVQVLPTESQWFGVTYQEDKVLAKAKLAELVENGTYPEKLWD